MECPCRWQWHHFGLELFHAGAGGDFQVNVGWPIIFRWRWGRGNPGCTHGSPRSGATCGVIIHEIGHTACGLKGNKLDLALPVTEAATTIGRDDGNSLQLPDPQVSKRHAVIRAKGENWTIEDLNSTNGVTVNGLSVKRAELKNGDRIHIGPFVLVFESTTDDEWVPSLVIDMSSKVAHQTIVPAPRGPAAGPDGRRA